MLADLGLTCCAGDCPRTTAVSVVLNKRQTTSPVDVAPSTDHLRGSMASLFWTMRREHGSRTMLWTYEWCVIAHAKRRSNHFKLYFGRLFRIRYQMFAFLTTRLAYLSQRVCTHSQKKITFMKAETSKWIL